MTSEDPLRERLVSVILREDTESAAGFSEAAFREVSQGQLEPDVPKRLGSRLYEHLFLWPVRNDYSSIRLVGEAVETAHTAEGCKSLGIDRATQRPVVEHVIGPPDEACWAYSRSRDGGFYRARAVRFATRGRLPSGADG